MNMKKLGVWLLALCLPVLFIGCSKSSSSSGSGAAADDTGTTTAAPATSLQVADKVSVVDAKLTNSVAAVAPLHAGLFKVTAADFGATTEYTKDKTQVWVSERSAESFGIINEILCMTGQTKYAEMLNKGPYQALVDTEACGSDDSGGSSSGGEEQEQASDAVEYESFTVVSSREDNSSPQIVKMWIHEKAQPQHQEMDAKVILGKLTITESKSDTNPYGMFQMDFIAFKEVGGQPVTDANFFKGTLKTERDSAGKIMLKLAFEENKVGRTGKQQITLDRSADGATGSGSVYEYWKEGTNPAREMAFDIAFNSTHFFRKDNTGSQVCLDRANFDESAWRFGLYDAAGARVKRNSGFSINTRADGTGAQGWVGFGGLWMNNTTTLESGATVYKFDYSSGASAPYTVFKAKGKLMKHTKKALTLGEIKGIPLDYYEQPMNGGQGTQYRVVWNAIDRTFDKIATMPQNCTGNCMWTDLASGQTISFGNLQWGELNFWSQSLGGEVRVPLTGCQQTFPADCVPGPFTYCQPTTACAQPLNTLEIVFFAQDLVYPTDTTVPAALACYDNCPAVDSATGEAYQAMNSGPSSTIATTYSFDSNTMVLKDNASLPVVMTVPTTMNTWGIHTGALVADTLVNKNLLDCNWDRDNDPATQPGICGWKARSVLNEFYTWQTGPDNWSQFTALKNADNTFLTFEPPLQVKYVHNKEPFNGSTFMMEYSGFGQLNGIPGMCVNMDTGEKIDCSLSNGNNAIRWVPAFVIPSKQADGQLTSVTAGGVTYYVKPLEMEQRMKKAADTTVCSNALTLTHFTLPDISIWVNPDISTEPTVTTAPKVIGGVIQ